MSIYRHIIACVVCLGSLASAYASGDDFTSRIYEIDTVCVTANRQRKSYDTNIGSRISKLDQGVLAINQARSLAEVLSENSSVYIKSMGQGAMSTSSFRGTSSSHTQVSWNGIKINPAMSSSFDFSQIPTFFADNVSLYHGNSYQGNGTGALGGTIDIENKPDFSSNYAGRAFFEYGSYDTYTGAASLKVGNSKFQSHTRGYYQQSENDFRYLNKVMSKDPFYENRKEAQYSQAGVMQELYYRPAQGHFFLANVWYQFGDRRLPQPIIVNVTQHEKQREHNIKSFIGYNYTTGHHSLNAKVAYLYSSLMWRKWFDSNFEGSTSNNASHSIQAKVDYTFTPSDKFRLALQGGYAYDRVVATSYSNHFAERNVATAQFNILWSPLPKRLSFNAQGLVELNNGRVAPIGSVGGVVHILPEVLQFKLNAGYNYRFPSMNDLYWQPGGNANLRPEHGLSYEATLLYDGTYLENSLNIRSEVSAYLMNIDDWIMWMPSPNTWFWQPKNVQNVLSYGAEANLSVRYTFRSFTVRASANYTYSRSMNRERRFDEDNTYRKQLPYIPKNKANGRLSLNYAGAFVNYTLNYVDERYTTEDESYKTTAYTVHNIELGYEWRIAGRYTLTPKLTIQNLCNTYYESTEFYPMPLRTFLGSLTFTF